MTDALARERKSHIWDRHPDDWYAELDDVIADLERRAAA